jgi:hypothetical protein
MSTELEHAVAEALRSRAGEVPHSPMPRLGTAPKPARGGRLVPVAAAAIAAVGIGVAAVAIAPAGETPPTPVATPPNPAELKPGEVYYSMTVSGAPGVQVVQDELWLSPHRTGTWRQRTITGESIEDGHVVPDGEQPGPPLVGECYPAETAGEELCTRPASWSNPTIDFLTTAPRDPAVIGRQVRADAEADLRAPVDEEKLAFAEMAALQYVLDYNGLPADLRPALKKVITELPGVEVTENSANILGERGTAYTVGYDGRDFTVIFDGDTAIGSPSKATRHGVAPGVGKAPSRMLD